MVELFDTNIVTKIDTALDLAVDFEYMFRFNTGVGGRPARAHDGERRRRVG